MIIVALKGDGGMNDRKLLLQKFQDFPALNNRRLAASSFQFPKRTDPRSASHRGRSEADTTTALRPGMSRSSGAISDLREALNQASAKTKFGETSLDQWQNIMQFAGSTIRRRAEEQRFEIIENGAPHWHDRDSVNLNANSASDWFNRVLLARIQEGAPYRHCHAILGDQGCGKSTLIKYLMSKNAEQIRKRKIVFSRFEFLKFWSEWRDQGQDIHERLSAYMSFIHLRDLVLDNFFVFVDGNKYVLKFEYKLAKRRGEEIERIAKDIRVHRNMFGIAQDDEQIFLTVANCVAEAERGNHELMTYLKALPHDQRMAMIGALWDEKCVVTIFDGMDSLRIEDAFQETEQWQAVKEIISTRSALSTPTRIRQQGVALENDSIIVIRKSTAALLEYSSTNFDQLGLQYYYNVASINSRAAMVSVIRRSLEDLSIYAESPEIVERDTFRLMKVVQRTMLAIGRSEGGSALAEDIYNLFDGNLRDLFAFVAATIDWSCTQMLRSGFLESKNYFGSVPTLIEALSSSRGNDFLASKSYRVIEQILLGEGGSFENAAAVVTTKDTLLQSGKGGDHIRSNPDHYGQIDNIFNYLNVGVSSVVDQHTLLEKVRLAQLLWNKALPQHQISEEMRKLFGYSPWNERMLLVLMLKTGFLSVDITRSALEFSANLRATSKAKLCINSLIGNLAYIENVFHRTLFPAILIDHISDNVRDVNSIEWAIVSIRNAYVFLTYFRHIERNAANGVSVPQSLCLFDRVRRRLVASLDRMTKALERPDDEARDAGLSERAIRARIDASEICTGALREIERTDRAWAKAGAAAGARP